MIWLSFDLCDITGRSLGEILNLLSFEIDCKFSVIFDNLWFKLFFNYNSYITLLFLRVKVLIYGTTLSIRSKTLFLALYYWSGDTFEITTLWVILSCSRSLNALTGSKLFLFNDDSVFNWTKVWFLDYAFLICFFMKSLFSYRFLSLFMSFVPCSVL